jgi:hypothetical protein
MARRRHEPFCSDGGAVPNLIHCATPTDFSLAQFSQIRLSQFAGIG